MREPWEEVLDEKLPRNDKEIPIVGRDWMLETDQPNNPQSEMQALMEASPGHEPVWEEPAETGIELLLDTVLSEEEKSVIEATIFAGHSIRKASEILGMPKSTVHRLQQSALEKLRKELGNG